MIYFSYTKEQVFENLCKNFDMLYITFAYFSPNYILNVIEV